MSMSDEIQRLQQLHQAGSLTDEEFQQAKAQLLQAAQAEAQRRTEAASGTLLPAERHAGVTPQQERQWGMFLHLSTFAGFVVPLFGLIAPILIWQMKKDEMPSLDDHGKVVANWILSALIYGMVSFVLSFVLIGIPLAIALSVLCIAFPIVGGIKANNGEVWKYPLSIQFLK